MQKAEKRFAAIMKKCNGSEISDSQVADLSILKSLNSFAEPNFVKNGAIQIGVLCALLMMFLVQWNIFDNSECIWKLPFDSARLFRQPEDCTICENVSTVDKVSNISSADFERLYIVTAKPVVVSDGASGWPALDDFSFEFFKKLYERSDNDRNNCQFFPYKTEFGSLEEALLMNPDRANLLPGEKPWYIGWSNCNDQAGEVLRKYYGKPYFLPNTSESMALNWIFMGGPGKGAHMHVDNVEYPSWQAQISGQKTWILAPPPECLYKCKTVDVTVQRGEIIVVDTNRWYHQTNILPGDISITIGSEFD